MDGRHMNRLMRVTLLTFVVSLVAWGLIAVWAVWDEIRVLLQRAGW